MKNLKKSRILLRACPRCHGDLFPDDWEEDFACLQCGRRVAGAQALREAEAVGLSRVA